MREFLDWMAVLLSSSDHLVAAALIQSLWLSGNHPSYEQIGVCQILFLVHATSSLVKGTRQTI
jgi:hypothetical protein